MTGRPLGDDGPGRNNEEYPGRNDEADRRTVKPFQRSASPEAVGMSRASGRLDGRDRTVLERLDPGQVVTPEFVEGLYRRHTDVRRPRTLRRRVKALMAHAAFAKVGFREWRFTGLE